MTYIIYCKLQVVLKCVLIMHFQGQIRYELNGYLPGTNFFGLNTVTGDIYATNGFVINNLNTYATFTVSTNLKDLNFYPLKGVPVYKQLTNRSLPYTIISIL